MTARRALCTLALGDSPLLALTRPLMMSYASRVTAEFVPIEGRYEGRMSNLRKLDLYEILGRFERVMFVDGDVAIRPDAPDLFDLVPEHRIGGYPEGAPLFERREILSRACAYYGAPPPPPERDWWVNTGVMLVSRCHRSLFAPAPRNARMFPPGFVDMPLLNARILHQGFEIERLELAWNYIGSIALRQDRPFEPQEAFCFHATSGLGSDRMMYLRRVLRHWDRLRYER